MDYTKRTQEIITFLLPYLIPAGKYAREIQARVNTQEDKCSADENSFAAALTDADLSVQNFFEVLLLSKFPDVDFFGEEAATSLNMQYFSQSEKIKILLDPIDGTLYYKNNSSLFSILLTFCSETEFLGNIVYQPALGRCFVSLRGHGAFELDHSAMSTGEIQQSISLNTTAERIVCYRCPEQGKKLASHFDVIDIATDYDCSSDFPHDLAGILRGEQCAVMTSHPQLIDSASIAFAVREAGGFVCDFTGQAIKDSDGFKTGLYDTLLVATSKSIAENILSHL